MKKALKIMGKILLVLLAVLLVLALVLFIGYQQMMKTDHELLKNAALSDAILYTVDGSELQYNVIYYGKADSALITDESGSGIDSLAKLAEVLGEADAPEAVLTAAPGSRTLGKAVTADITTDDKGNILTVTVKTVSERPVIGITWKKDSIGGDYKGFAEAFERNGAIAVFLPRATDADSAREILSHLDGIFVTGGEDWNPKLYGQEATPHGSSGWNDDRDTSDIHLMQQAIEMNIPMLTVCRGTQGLNVALGGGLIQDIPCYLGTKVLDGTIPESRVSKIMAGTLPGGEAGDSCGCEGESHLRVQVDGLSHGGLSFYHELDSGIDGIGIDKNSKWLYDIFGADRIELVATAHHQAIDPNTLAEGLTVVAKSSDGIIEAVEYQDNLFALALQWHPERDALSDTRLKDVSQDLSNLPLRELVKYATVYAAEH